MDREADDLTVYELGYHLFPSVGDDGVPGLVTALKTLIESHHGAVIAEEFPKRIMLAYPISGIYKGVNETADSAYFGWIKFEMVSHELPSLLGELRATDFLLRFLLIKTVRESTLVSRKLFLTRTEVPREEKIKVRREEPGPKLSEEEIDRTIEELLVE